VNPSQEPASAVPPTTDPALPSGLPYPPPHRAQGGPEGGYGWYADSSGWLAGMRPPRRPWRRTLTVGVLTTLVIAALGVPLGLLWSWLSPAVPVLRNAQADVVVNDASPEQFVAADGWFAIAGFGFGIVVAIAAWLILRRDRGPALLLGAVLGSLAAAPVAWQVGRRIGLSGYERWLDSSAPGDTFSRPPDLHAYGALLVPAFAAVIVCTLLAGWSNDPDLEAPGARPGYGPNAHSAGTPEGEDEFSWGSPAGPDPTAAPAPPAPGSAGSPHG
jgi:hypothetical protein